MGADVLAMLFILTETFFEQNFIFIGTQSGFGAIMSIYSTHRENDERFIPFEDVK